MKDILEWSRQWLEQMNPVQELRMTLKKRVQNVQHVTNTKIKIERNH